MEKLTRYLINILCKAISFFFTFEFIKFHRFIKNRISTYSISRKLYRIGINPIFDSKTYIINPQKISIGHNFVSLYNLRLECYTNYLDKFYEPELIIGDNVTINTDCHIGVIDKVEIGNNTLIASKVFISDHSHGDPFDLNIPPNKRLLTSKGSVKIGNNVWIGENVSILSGVTIGDNSIIGTCSVVNKDVPKNSIFAGVPAKIIKTNK